MDWREALGLPPLLEKPAIPETAFEVERRRRLDAEMRLLMLNDKQPIIVWKDKTRTVVKKQKGDTYDAEKGLAMAFIKKVFENQGNYNDLFKKFGKE